MEKRLLGVLERKPMDYGRAIRIARNVKDLSQKDLAKLTGVSGNYISMIESGKRVPSVDMLGAMAKAMDVPVYLLALIGSDQEDLRGIPFGDAQALANELLEMVSSAKRA